MSEQKKILFVDQDNSVGKVLQLKMNSLGYNTEYAETLSDAFVILKSFLPDMIFSETDFDNGTGLDFLKYLRLNPDTSKIPVFFISNARNVENKIIALEMGAENIYSKPITIKFIEDLISKYFNRSLSDADSGSEEKNIELSGKLINVSLYDLFAIIEKNGRSGILNIKASGDEKAFIYFVNGSVVRAESFQNPDPDNGLSLIYDVSGWNDGLFTILYDDKLKPVKNIFVSQKSLMMNLEEYLQENVLRSRELPEPDKTVYINFKRFFENLSKFPDSIAGVLRNVKSEGVLIEDLLRKESGFSRKKSEYVKKLIDMGVLVFEFSDEKYEIPDNPEWFNNYSENVSDMDLQETEVVPETVEDIFADESDEEFEELEEIEEFVEPDLKAKAEDLIDTKDDFLEETESKDESSLETDDELKTTEVNLEIESSLDSKPETEEKKEDSTFDELSVEIPDDILSNEEKEKSLDVDLAEGKHSDIDEIFDSRESKNTDIDPLDLLLEGDGEDANLFAEPGSEIEFIEAKKDSLNESDSNKESNDDDITSFQYNEVVDEAIIDKTVDKGRKSIYFIMIPALVISLSIFLVAAFYVVNRFLFDTPDTVNSIKFERLLTEEEKANKEVALLYGTNPKFVKNKDRIDVKNMTIAQIAKLAKKSFKNKDYEKAASYYRIAVMNAVISTPEERKHEGLLWKNMAISLYYLGAYKKALSAVEKSLLISKEPIKIDLKVAILQDSDRSKEAAKTLEKAIKDSAFKKYDTNKWKEQLKKIRK